MVISTTTSARLLTTLLACILIPFAAHAQNKGPAYSLVVQMSHGGYLTTILFDPPRRQMATVSSTGEIKIWDLVHKQEVWTFTDKVSMAALGLGSDAVSFNTDGTALAIAGDNGVITIIDLKTGKSTTITLPFAVITSITFSAAGDKLAIGGATGRIDIAYLSSHSKVDTVYDPPPPSHDELVSAMSDGKGLNSVSTIRFTPTGDTVITGSFQGDISELDLRETHATPRLLLHADGKVASLTYVNDMLMAALVNLTTNSVGIWDVKNKKEVVARNKCNTQVNIPNVALGGDIGVTTCFDDQANTNTYELWSLPSGEKLPIPVSMQKMRIQSPPGISNDGLVLTTTDGNQRLTVIDRRSPALPQDMEQSPVHMIEHLDYISATQELDVTSGDQAYLWKTSGTTEVKNYFAKFGQVAFTDDGLWMAYFDWNNRLRIENRNDHTTIDNPVSDTLVFRIAMSSVGPTVFWMNGGGYGGYAKFWRSGETNPHVLCETQLGGEIAVSQKGTYSLIGCNRGQQRFSSSDVLLFRIRDMDLLNEERGDLTGVESFAPRAVSVTSLFFTPDEVKYGINFGYQLRIRETQGDKKLDIASGDTWRFVYQTAVSSDSKYLAAEEIHAAIDDVDPNRPGFLSARIALLDLKTGARIHEPSIESPAKGLLFLKDKLLVGSLDGTVTVRSLPNLTTLATLVQPNGWLAIAPDGFFDGNSQALHWIGWRPENQRTIIPLDLLYDNFYRPDLLIDVLDSKYKPSKPTLGTELGLGSLEIMARQGYVHIEKSGSDSFLCFSDPPVHAVNVYSDGAPLAFGTDQIVRGRTFSCPWAAPLPRDATKIESVVDQSPASHKSGHCPDSAPVSNRPPANPGVLRLLTVAVGSYSRASGYPSLPASVPSAIAIETLFSNQPRGQGHLFLHVDVRPGVRDGGIPPTLINIRKSWAELVARTKPEDTVVLFLSGHGLVPEGTQMFYFAPLDFDTTSLSTKQATGVNVAMIADMIREVPARNILLVIDSCQSGAALTSLARIGEIKIKTQAKLASGQAVGVYTLASASAFQKAISLTSKDISPLAKVLKDGANQKGPKRVISVGSLMQDVCRKLPRETGQTPLVYLAGKNFPLLEVP